MPREAVLTRRHRVRKMALALVLSYHQVDGLLSIVEVKLVVLLLVYALSIVVEIFAIQICWDFGTILA